MTAMLIAYVALNIAWLLVWQHHAHRHIGLTLGAMAADLLPYLGAAAVSVYGAAWLMQGADNVYASLAGKVAVAAAAYIIIMRLSGSVMFRESIEFLFKREKR